MAGAPKAGLRLVEQALVWPHAKSDNDAHVDHELRAIRAYKRYTDSRS
jgi:hypothetical protein